MKHSIASLRRLRRLQRAAPALAFAVFLVSGAFQTRVGISQSVMDARSDAVALALEDVPLRRGAWIGEIAPFPVEASEILQTRALKAWRFQELGTERNALLGIVYCGDVRDMNGHFPPVCYPSQGWSMAAGEPESVSLEFDGTPFDARVWRFTLVGQDGATASRSVLGFFLFADEPPTSSDTALGERAGRRAASEQGVAQIQLVFDGFPSLEEIGRTAKDLLPIVPIGTVRQLRGAQRSEQQNKAGTSDVAEPPEDRVP